MKHLLFNNQNIIYNRDIALEIGDKAACVLQQVAYWIEKNENQGKNYVNNRYWVYSTFTEWHERDFYHWSLSTVMRVFNYLEKLGLLICENYNEKNMTKQNGIL